MLRSLSWPVLALFCMALPAAAQTADPNAAKPASQSQDPAASAEAKKPKKVLTNEDLAKSNGRISVVGDAKGQPKSATPRAATPQYIASVRQQLEKLQTQIDDIDKQITDLKNVSEGEPSTKASGIQLNKSLERTPIEVQIRALQNKKKDLQSKLDALLDEARKKGVEPGDLR
ncbi:MAG TPA: hypothetical protein VNB49_16040 [Candidatus Dormibacteraeota bacterium]|nr:hypothetical protein [Candidatus Dormibacteraeota bacterium]